MDRRPDEPAHIQSTFLCTYKHVGVSLNKYTPARTVHTLFWTYALQHFRTHTHTCTQTTTTKNEHTQTYTLTKHTLAAIPIHKSNEDTTPYVLYVYTEYDRATVRSHSLSISLSPYGPYGYHSLACVRPLRRCRADALRCDAKTISFAISCTCDRAFTTNTANAWARSPSAACVRFIYPHPRIKCARARAPAHTHTHTHATCDILFRVGVCHTTCNGMWYTQSAYMPTG